MTKQGFQRTSGRVSEETAGVSRETVTWSPVLVKMTGWGRDAL